MDSTILHSQIFELHAMTLTCPWIEEHAITSFVRKLMKCPFDLLLWYFKILTSCPNFYETVEKETRVKRCTNVCLSMK